MNLFFLFVSKVFFLAKQHRSIAFLPSTSFTFCKLQVAIQQEKQKKMGKKIGDSKKMFTFARRKQLLSNH